MVREEKSLEEGGLCEWRVRYGESEGEDHGRVGCARRGEQTNEREAEAEAPGMAVDAHGNRIGNQVPRSREYISR